MALAATLTISAQHGEFVGGDISLLPLYEKHNSGYLDGDGKKIDDLVNWFTKDCGWNSFRVRLFVDPKEKNGKGATDHCVCQNLDYVKALGKRIKDAGAKFMLDIHYSDTWADPSYQIIPASWTDTSNEGLTASVSAYTADVMKQLKEAGAEPDLVQIGNEISYGMLIRNNADKVYPAQEKSANATAWNRLATLLQAASKAVRDNSSAKIIIHTERTGKSSETVNFYNCIKDVDYDIIGLSYYPFYQGSLSLLSSTLNNLATSFPDKKVQIVETSYPFQYYPSDNVYDTSSTWAASANGQYAFTNALITELAKHENVNGLYWWQPEEAGNGDDSKWDTTGATVMSGWMSRGMWWCDTKTDGHWPVKADDGMVAYQLKNFLAPSGMGISKVTNCTSASRIWYNLAGQRVSTPTQSGIYINQGRKIVTGK